jgi:hypothetical protein
MQHNACALHAGYLRLQTHTPVVYGYYFPTATMVLRTRLNVTFIRTVPFPFNISYSFLAFKNRSLFVNDAVLK